MPTSLDTYAPFDAGAGGTVTEDMWRQFMQYVTGRQTAAMNGVLRGIANGLEVYADATGMQVKVKTGECWIKGHWGKNSAEKTLAIAAADPTNPRKDRVVLRADFVDNVVELDVKTGTPAGSPAAPLLSQVSTEWETSLAIVDVPATDTSIAANQVGDARNFVDDPDVRQRLTADQTKNANVSLSELTDLTCLVSGLSYYAVEGFIEYSASTAADVQLQMLAENGSSGRLGGPGLAPTATATTGSVDVSTQPVGTSITLGGAGVGTKINAHISGWVLVPEAAAAGSLNTVRFRWAQNASDATNTIIYAGSWIRLSRL